MPVLANPSVAAAAAVQAAKTERAVWERSRLKLSEEGWRRPSDGQSNEDGHDGVLTGDRDWQKCVCVCVCVCACAHINAGEGGIWLTSRLSVILTILAYASKCETTTDA